MKKVGQGILELLIEKGFGTFDPGDLDLRPSNPKINWFHLLPRMDSLIKFEEGMSRRSQVIDWKRKGTGGRTYNRPTDRYVQSSMPSLLQWGHNKKCFDKLNTMPPSNMLSRMHGRLDKICKTQKVISYYTSVR